MFGLFCILTALLPLSGSAKPSHRHALRPPQGPHDDALILAGIAPFTAQLPYNTFALLTSADLRPEEASSQSGTEMARPSLVSRSMAACSPTRPCIWLSRASYGNAKVDSSPYFATGSCHFPASLTRLRDLCDGKTSCDIDVATTFKEDPCPWAAKTLAVAYGCQWGVKGETSLAADHEGRHVQYDRAAERLPENDGEPPFMVLSSRSADCAPEDVLPPANNVRTVDQAAEHCRMTPTCEFFLHEGEAFQYCAGEAWTKARPATSAEVHVKPQAVSPAGYQTYINKKGRCPPTDVLDQTSVGSVAEAAVRCVHDKECIAFTLDYTVAKNGGFEYVACRSRPRLAGQSGALTAFPKIETA
ncbi:unnamed protein product [Vitrella brassicaformis CCMP3155]|uniref:SUEL-type lectin domain-containing protein n=1 Tax=Vitrella brassicaformis (strain CCMP3155) TaxID=1169540 RepID=A0A0G4FN72_VITBC|nr:unnamed protein product [Vitrella brassicaformis CCMP3155]|eukprot:CEM15694.1 unnamed protein product [Vitrella brassicaformis CCMP3155]